MSIHLNALVETYHQLFSSCILLTNSISSVRTLVEANKPVDIHVYNSSMNVPQHMLQKIIRDLHSYLSKELNPADIPGLPSYFVTDLFSIPVLHPKTELTVSEKLSSVSTANVTIASGSPPIIPDNQPVLSDNTRSSKADSVANAIDSGNDINSNDINSSFPNTQNNTTETASMLISEDNNLNDSTVSAPISEDTNHTQVNISTASATRPPSSPLILSSTNIAIAHTTTTPNINPKPSNHLHDRSATKYVILLGYDPQRRAHSFNRLRSRCQPIDILAQADYSDNIKTHRIQYIITHDNFDPEIDISEQERVEEFKSYNSNAMIISERDFLKQFDQSNLGASSRTTIRSSKSSASTVRISTTHSAAHARTTTTSNAATAALPRKVTPNITDREVDSTSVVPLTVSGYDHGKTTAACTRLRKYPFILLIQQHEIVANEALIQKLKYIITPDDFDVANNTKVKSSQYIAKCLRLNPQIQIQSESKFIKLIQQRNKPGKSSDSQRRIADAATLEINSIQAIQSKNKRGKNNDSHPCSEDDADAHDTDDDIASAVLGTTSSSCIGHKKQKKRCFENCPNRAVLIKSTDSTTDTNSSTGNHKESSIGQVVDDQNNNKRARIIEALSVQTPASPNSPVASSGRQTQSQSIMSPMSYLKAAIAVNDEPLQEININNKLPNGEALTDGNFVRPQPSHFSNCNSAVLASTGDPILSSTNAPLNVRPNPTSIDNSLVGMKRSMTNIVTGSIQNFSLFSTLFR